MALTHFLTHNAGWKLTSLVLAVGIWAFVHSAQDTTLRAERRTFPLPVTVMTSAEDPRTFQVQPSTVNVTVSGPSDSLEVLLADDIQVFVNLVGVQSAHDLQARVLARTPPGISLLQIDTPEVRVQSTVSSSPNPG